MDKKYQTKADFWGIGDVKEITIEKKGGDIFVDGKKVKMLYNNIQLRFERESCVYIIFDDSHNPPLPIAQMYEELKK